MAIEMPKTVREQRIVNVIACGAGLVLGIRALESASRAGWASANLASAAGSLLPAIIGFQGLMALRSLKADDAPPTPRAIDLWPIHVFMVLLAALSVVEIRQGSSDWLWICSLAASCVMLGFSLPRKTKGPR